MDLSDIPKIRGPLKYVGYVGVIVMMGGLGAFAFGLLPMLGNIDPEHIPSGLPPLAIYGFGVAAVGAILASIAVGLGDKRDEPLVHVGDRFDGDFQGTVVTRPSGPVDARTYIVNQQRIYVKNIDWAVQGLRPGRAKKGAEAAADEVADAVERGDDWGVADALGRLTNILQAAGAFAIAGNTAAPAIIALARTIGSAGNALLNWFGA
jgi:hypothetical protein